MKKIIRASFDVDAQKGFTPLCPNELPIKNGDTIVPGLELLASKCDYRVGSKDWHNEKAVWKSTKSNEQLTKCEGYKNVDVYWNMHCVGGELGAELLPNLPHPSDYDFFVWKGMEPDIHPYGACYHDLYEKISTGVIEFLKSKEVTEVYLGGLALDYCVLNTALQLVHSGFKVFIYIPATRAIDSMFKIEHLEKMSIKAILDPVHLESIIKETE